MPSGWASRVVVRMRALLVLSDPLEPHARAEVTGRQPAVAGDEEGVLVGGAEGFDVSIGIFESHDAQVVGGVDEDLATGWRARSSAASDWSRETSGAGFSPHPRGGWGLRLTLWPKGGARAGEGGSWANGAGWWWEVLPLDRAEARRATSGGRPSSARRLLAEGGYWWWRAVALIRAEAGGFDLSGEEGGDGWAVACWAGAGLG